MTKEKAISFLYSIASSLGFTDVEYYTCKDGEKMREAIKALEQELSSSEKLNKWIPASERYPEDGQRVLVDYCDEDAGVMLIRFNANRYRAFKAWMPLPKSYKQEVEE